MSSLVFWKIFTVYVEKLAVLAHQIAYFTAIGSQLVSYFTAYLETTETTETI